MLSFHWTTLLQDTLGITGAGYTTNTIYMIVYLGNRLLYFCTVKRSHTRLQQWCNCRGCQGVNLLFGKLNIKTGSPLSLYFGVKYSFVFSSLLLFVFFGSFLDCFRVILGFVWKSTSGYTLISQRFSECWQVGLLPWPVSPLQPRFPSWLKRLVAPLQHNFPK